VEETEVDIMEIPINNRQKKKTCKCAFRVLNADFYSLKLDAGKNIQRTRKKYLNNFT
jgi:hypothetical protein